MALPSVRTTELAELAAWLDAATHEDRVAWCYGLNERSQKLLWEKAEGGLPVYVEQLVGAEGAVIRHVGRNGLPLFNRFEKRFTRLGEAVVGYNHNPAPLSWVTGPGHYAAYDSPVRPGEVWIDYRTLPQTQHPAFPPLRSNEHGLPGLIFGNMVDVLRRVSEHVTIGEAFKNMDREGPVPLMARIGSMFPTAPFVLCRAP